MLIGIDASRVTDALQTGTERYSREIIRAMLELAPEHRFRLYARPEASRLTPGSAAAEQVSIGPPRLWTHLGLARELRRNPPGALFVPAHVLPVSSAWEFKPVRKVVMLHDVGFRYFPRAHPLRQRLYLEFSTRFAVRYADIVLALSEHTRQDLIRSFGASPDKVRAAPPGPPALQVSDRLERSDTSDPIYALFVGTQQPRKNLARLLEAWARLGGDAVLLIAGKRGWGGQDLHARASTLGIAGRVRFLGFIDEAHKARLMRGARAVIVPSLYEGFGLPVLEAQSAGVPVACSSTSALPEAAGEGALQFDPQDTGDMAAAIRRVMGDEALRARLIEAGRRNLMRFDWARSARAVLDALTL